MTATARDLTTWLDERLGTAEHPDYEGALNGLQLDHRGPVRRIAAAVDASQRTIVGAAERGANFLMVHHGLLWGSPRRLTGSDYARLRRLMDADMAVYASHLPLDSHPEFGNNVLLARALGLTPSHGFAPFQGVPVGLGGTADVPTAQLVAAAGVLARSHGGDVRTTVLESGRRTRRWAICTGAGASSDTIREAEASGIDTLIVGEGPHHTAVDAPERGLVIIYAGHYATETLGVAALAERLAAEFALPWDFVSAPTGL
jgi:dinuclear metal center YbgI/SA1388 family protein